MSAIAFKLFEIQLKKTQKIKSTFFKFQNLKKRIFAKRKKLNFFLRTMNNCIKTTQKDIKQKNINFCFL